MANNLYTGSDNITKKEQEQSELLLNSAQVAGASAALLGAANYYVNSNEKARAFTANLPGANRYRAKYEEARAHALARGVVPIDLNNIYDNQSFGRSMLSVGSTVEELSPMGVLKTLQLTNFIEPFVAPTAVKASDVFVKGAAVQAYESLYRAQLAKNNRTLDATHLKYGFVLRDGQLFQMNPDGTVNHTDPVVRNARIVTSHVKMGERLSPNRVLQKYANIQGVSLPHNAFTLEQSVVIGDNSKSKFAFDWARAYFRQGMEIGYKTMDNPLGGLEDILKATGVDNMPFAETDMYKAIKGKLNLNLGTNGNYQLSTRESLQIMSKNIAVKSAALYLGYQGINQVLNKVTDEDSIWNDGIVSGMAHLYAGTRINVAEVAADPFQAYKKEQEYAAQGSTSLVTLAGFPIAGATLGASMSYYKRLSDSAKLGVEAATSLSETPSDHGMVDNIFKRMGIKETTPFKSNAIKGALIGALIAAPFLPGALIGESSDELRERYSGKKEVENRANRWWLAGGNRFEGEQIKNYQASFIARTMANSKDEALYDGDMKKKLDYDPLYSPLKYLRNPYKYEEDTQDSRPYPVWGMEVNYGSFLGKLFQATVGEVIKPTILSPQLKDSLAIGGQAINGEEVALGEGETRDAEAVVIDSNSPQGYELATKKGLEQGSNSAPPVAIKNSDGSYSVKTEPRRKDKQLIESGMMLREEDARVDPVTQPLTKAYAALGDFVGLKGFIGNSILDSLGLNLEESQRQLARSGHATSLATLIQEQNLGDIGGIGEFQRRMVPTSASSKQDTINPIRNTVAPSWLPKDESKYYLDFGKGDYWDKVDNAEVRLPGKGYASLHEDVKGLDPENYPLAHRYKILSDVAMGSEEQIALKKQLLAKVNAGEIVGKDKDLFYTTLEQEQNKAKKRKFNEYLTDEQKDNLSTSGKILNKLWEAAAHNAENPLEPLTPFRPGSKFIHARSAIEDYNKTMLQGPDTGIWTSPYEHFVRVAWNRSRDALFPGVQKPIEAVERDNVEEYFDKLEYIKARQSGDTNTILKTTIGRSFAGIQNQVDMNRFKRSLSKDQQLYVDSFAREADPEKRKEILKMLPSDVGMAYMDIWNNTGVAEKAKRSGRNVDEDLREEYKNNTKKIAEVYKVQPATSSPEKRYNTKDPDGDLETRLKAADIEAERYVESRTGIPSKDWLGWDPRLSMQDIKLRTLTVGKADIFRYGFWNTDKERNDRIVALDKEQEITDKYQQIKKKLRDTNEEQEQIKRQMFEKGIVTDKVVLSEASQNDVRVSIKQSE